MVWNITDMLSSGKERMEMEWLDHANLYFFPFASSVILNIFGDKSSLDPLTREKA